MSIFIISVKKLPNITPSTSLQCNNCYTVTKYSDSEGQQSPRQASYEVVVQHGSIQGRWKTSN